MLAKDVMTTDVVAVSPKTSVQEVARLLLARRISAVPVLDAKERLRGIVSEGDLIRHAHSRYESHRSWWLALLTDRDEAALDYVKTHGGTAADVMTRQVITIGERMPLAKIADLLERSRIKRVPVLRAGKVVGIVSRANLLHGLATQKVGSGSATVSDRQTRSRILKQLDKAGVNHSRVNVVVTDDKIELWGFVESESQKHALRVAAETMKGSRGLVSNVTVITPILQASIGAQ